MCRSLQTPNDSREADAHSLGGKGVCAVKVCGRIISLQMLCIAIITHKQAQSVREREKD